MNEAENRNVKAEPRQEPPPADRDREHKKTNGDRGGYAGGDAPDADPDPERI